MKNVIFQFYVPFNGIGKNILKDHFPDKMPDWARYSTEYFKEYAKRHNADYYFFNERFVNSTSNFFEICRLYKDELFDNYDKLLYCDVDVMPKNMDTNVFDIDIVDVAGWSEWRHPDVIMPINWSAGGGLAQRFADFGAPIVNSKNGIRMINSGVMLWSKEARLKARENFIDHEKYFHHKNALLDPIWTHHGHSSHCLDQPFLNCNWNKLKFDVKELDIIWNRFPTKDENRECVFAHYVGEHRFNIPKMFKEMN
tara:strand:- start:4013 stop:4774 length:762 start_codon:yes stop_codon:yes gene_type:complete